MSSDKKYDIKSLRKVFEIALKHKLYFALAAIFSILVSALATANPIITRMIIDDYIIPEKQDGLSSVILILFVVILLQFMTQYFFIFLANWIGHQVIKDLRIKLYKAILDFKLQYFDTTPVGVPVTRVVNDINTISQIFGDGILTILGDLLKIIIVISVMLYINVKLSIIVFSIIPILFIATRVFQKAIKKSFKEVRNQVSNLNSFAQEMLSGMNIIQVFAKEKDQFLEFDKINKKHFTAHRKTVINFALFFPIVDLLSSITLGIIIWYGGVNAISNGSISIGDLVSFIAFIEMIFRPMRQIADKMNTIQNGLISVDRVMTLIESNQKIPDNGKITKNTVQGQIEFKDVKFGYSQNQSILKGISFEIKPKQTVAIVGSTGAGKSTIINLLSRNYDINNGSILLDNIDIKDYKLKNLKSHITTVLQDVFLFSDTILNNIKTNSKIKKQEIIQIAKDIEIHDFIMSLPNNYDYIIGERGASLSAGQKQLLSFMRAYISNPSVLILDEATSSIDKKTEELIQKATQKITKNRTSIIIAHRLSTIKNADKIIVLDKGEIVETGTHDELILQNGFYNKLYNIS